MSAAPKVLAIDLSLPIPAYRQIVDGLRAQLVGGAFTAGEQLPTVRQLAVDLGIHHNTVAEAYRTLADEGWLELGRRRGATVLDRSAPKASRATRAQFGKRLRELVAEARASGMSFEALREELTALLGSTGKL
jgi:DNA-binding transcriptional regulator YhcF (GntR family)